MLPQAHRAAEAREAQLAGVGPRETPRNDQSHQRRDSARGRDAALWFLQPIFLLGITVIVAVLAFGEYAGIAAKAGAHVSRPAGSIAVALVCVASAVPGMPD